MLHAKPVRGTDSGETPVCEGGLPSVPEYVGGVRVLPPQSSLLGLSIGELQTAWWGAALAWPTLDTHPLSSDNMSPNAGCLRSKPADFPQLPASQTSDVHFITGTLNPQDEVGDFTGTVRSCENIKPCVPIVIPAINTNYYYIPSIDFSDADTDANKTGRLTPELANSWVVNLGRNQETHEPL
ncbi:hypothetical protein FOA52_005359 [Chlamydomonas sp. UWO 241]|nr:hypothetical protein FOA52_005359 [Chlamydomonas sp. UWO 241]